MPNWKKVIVSGSNADLNQVTASQLAIGAGDAQYSFPTSTGSQNHTLVVDTDGNLIFSDISGSLNDGIVSSSQQIVNYDEFLRIRGGNTISGSQTFLGDNIQFGPDPNSPDGAETTFLMVTGSLVTTGFISGLGGLIIGDNTPDDINTPDTVDFQARVTSSFIPQDDNIFDLGSGSLRWNTVHANNLEGTASRALTASYAENVEDTFPYTGSAIISGSLDTTGSLNITGSLMIVGDIDSVGRINTDDGMRSVFVGREAGKDEASGFRYNTGIGYVALESLNSGVCNTSIGFQSLGFTTTGDNNVGLGIWAGLGIQTGNNNTYVGSEAGYSFSGGANRAENTVVGYRAQYNGSTGDCNSILGACSGYSLTTGNLNTILGWRAAAGLTTGGSNVFIGGNAGYSATSGSNNVVLGYNSSLQNNGDSNSIVIGNNATGSGTNTIMIGSETHTDTRIFGQVEIDGITDVSESIAALNHFSESRAWSSGSFSGSFFGDGSGLTGVTADGTISSSAQIATEISGAFTSTSSSLAATIEDIVDGTTTVPSASHAVSASFSETATSALSAESATSASYIQWNLVTEKPNGIVSSSTQITAHGFISESFSTAGTGIVSGSVQLATEISGAFTSTSSSLAATIEDIVDGTTTVPSASLAATASYISSSNIVGQINASTVDWDDINDVPEDIVSSSTQITGLGFISESFSTAGTGITSGSAQIVTLLDGQNLNLGVVSASILHELYTTQSINLGSGSFQFGDTTDDTHTFTGSILAHNGVTGSLFGTASIADTASIATTASYAVNADNAVTASHAENALTASHALTSITASYVENAQSASYVTTAQTASYVTTAQTASYVTTAQTASYVTTSQTASYVNASNIDGDITASHVDWTNIENTPENIVSGAAQIVEFGVFATTASNTFTGNQTINASTLEIDNTGDAQIILDRGANSNDAEIVFQTNNTLDWTIGTGQVGGDADFTIRHQNSNNVFRLSSTGLNINTSVSASEFSGSFRGNGSQLTDISASYIDWTNIDSVPADIVSSSAQIATEISGAFNSASSSLATDVSASDARLDVLDSLGLVSGSSTLVQVNALSASGDLHVVGQLFGDGSSLTGITSSLIQNGLLFGLGLLGGTYNGELDVTGSLDTSSGHFLTGSRSALEGFNDLALTGSLLGTATTSSYVDWSNVDSIPANIVSSSAQISSEISGAFTADSASFSSSIASLEAFSSSLDATFATEAELNSATQSLSSSIASDIEDILDGTTTVPSASFAATASYITSSNIVGNIEADSISYTNITGIPADIVSSSAQISSEISGAFTADSASFSSSIASLETFSSSLDTTFTTEAELNSATQSLSSSLAADIASNASASDSNGTTIANILSNTLLSSSAQIATDISGAFTSDSASFAEMISTSNADFDVFTAQYLNDTGSFLTTSSINNATITVTKGDSTTYTLTVDNVANATSASYVSASNIDGNITADSIAYSNITGLPTLVSGSTQVVNLLNGQNVTLGEISATSINTSIVSSSITFTSGSNIFGDEATDVHEFTGSVEVQGGITGSLLGTATTASYIQASNIDGDITANSASYASTASLATGLQMVSVDSTDQQFTVALVDTSSRSVVSYDTFDLTFNPSSGLLDVTGLMVQNFTITASNVGQGTISNAQTASVATTADTALSANTASLAEAVETTLMPGGFTDIFYPMLATNSGSNSIVAISQSMTFTRSTQTLSIPNFTGSFAGDGSSLTGITANTASYVAASTVTNVTTYRETVTGASSYQIDHNLNEQYPVVQCWNTSNSQMEIPASITTNSANRVTVDFGLPFTGRIVVKI